MGSIQLIPGRHVATEMSLVLQAAIPVVSWGQHATGCAEVSGSVENLGKPFPDNPESIRVRNPRLSYVFFPDFDDHVSIQQLSISAKEKGELEVTGLGADGPLVRKAFLESSKDCSCETGRIVIRRLTDMRSEGARFYSKSEFRISAASGGPVVVERHNVTIERTGPKEPFRGSAFRVSPSSRR